jgi:hypothetical protein
MKMPDPRKEIAALKAENKKLKALLKNAVRLLRQSKEILQNPKNLDARKQPKKAARKKARSTAS